MASKNEGIALLSMYNDEDDEDDEELEEVEEEPKQLEAIGYQIEREAEEIPRNSVSTPPMDSNPDEILQELSSPSPILSNEPVNIKTPRSPPPPPIDFRVFDCASPQLETVVLDQRARIGALAMVDYEHDDADMSPEAEEGEIPGSGAVMLGLESRAFTGIIEERTPPGTVQILTPTTQPESLQPFDLAEQSKSETSMAIDSTGTEPKFAQIDAVAAVSEEVQKDDLLKSFLPPPTAMCSVELQGKINKFLAYKRAGKSFNADLRSRKDYRNPDFLQHAVRYQDIDQLGTCFGKDVFDPHGYDKNDYYDAIEANMRREVERKEQERKRSQKQDFVSGGMQPGLVSPALKIGSQIPVTGFSAAVTSGSVSTVVDVTSRDSRQNKKSKWDKIDGDVKNHLHSGGHDNLSALGVHAVQLSAANAGTGYTAFAQQKRREAEERRLGERNLDKRSS